MTDAVLKLIEAAESVLPKLHEPEKGHLEFHIAAVKRQREHPQSKEPHGTMHEVGEPEPELTPRQARAAEKQAAAEEEAEAKADAAQARKDAKKG